jgi:hypothetical protein
MPKPPPVPMEIPKYRTPNEVWAATDTLELLPPSYLEEWSEHDEIYARTYSYRTPGHYPPPKVVDPDIWWVVFDDEDKVETIPVSSKEEFEDFLFDTFRYQSEDSDQWFSYETQEAIEEAKWKALM